MDKNLTSREVAEWLGLDPAVFAKKRRRLTAEHGFPEPLPGMGKYVWSPMSLTAWLASLLPAGQRKALAAVAGETGETIVSGRPNVAIERAVAARIAALAGAEREQGGRAA